MKRLAPFALVLALVALACTNDNRASLQIQSICFPTDDCTFSETCDAQFIGPVTLDTTTSATDTLVLFLQLENQLPDNTNLAAGRVNTYDAHVDETRIEFDVAAGSVPPSAIGSNFFVPAAGHAVISVPIVLTGAGPGDVVAHVRMRGYRDDGSRFETGEFPITIRVCAGCAPAACGAAGTCPPSAEGQRPISCIQ